MKALGIFLAIAGAVIVYFVVTGIDIKGLVTNAE